MPAAPSSSSQLSCALLLLLFISGCAVAIESSQVSRRFASVFACPDPHVVTESGGYRVEGCGVVAHFRCIDTDDDWDEGSDEGGVAGALIGAAIDGALEADECVMEHSERLASTPERPRVESATKAPQDGPILKARVPIAGGYVLAHGKPRKHPAHALLTLYSTAELTDQECQAELFHDGVPVPVVSVARAGDHTVHLAVPIAALKDAHRAARFAGTVCGRDLDLDPFGRELLGLFYARFHEELARAPLARPRPPQAPQSATPHAATSGGELSAQPPVSTRSTL